MLQPPEQPELAFYITVPSTCNYLPGRKAVTVFADPFAGMSKALYSTLVDHGFRRSGDHVYVPYCPNCDACVPARIPVQRFRMKRSQRRNWQRNADITVHRVAANFQEEHYRLYQRYVTQRHPGGGMEHYGPEQYLSFFGCRWGETWLYEFRCGNDLLAVASVDHLQSGLSAVYTFFDPAQAERGLGTYAVLWQINEAIRLNLPFVYLGYWIAESCKMNYKANFQPLEIYRTSRWIDL